MFDTLCTYPLISDLFAQAIHPSEPILAFGLATGDVSLHRLPSSSTAESPKNGCGTIDTAWHTRRHMGSCRALTFSQDGAALLSAGVDGLVKIAETETGGIPDPPTLLSTPSPSTLLLATESGALHLYDLRTPSSSSTTQANTTTNTSNLLALPSEKPTKTFKAIHTDFITSLTPLPNNQILTTGAASVSITDLRRDGGGVLITSEDQDEELLSSTICGDKAVVGGERGALRIWDVGEWNDQETVVDVSPRGCCTVDVLAGREEGLCAVGCDDGVVRFVDVMATGKNRVKGEVKHDDVEGVMELGWMADGRLVSGGGAVVKIWEEAGRRVSYTSDEEGEEEEEEEEEGEDGNEVVGNGLKRGNGVLGSDEEDDGDEADDSDEEDQPKKRSKKRKRAKGKKGQVGNGIMAFKGLT